MNGNDGYAVFFFPQALEALGEAIKPYLQDGPAGPHVVCGGVDTGGAFIEMSLRGATAEGRAVELELMVPSGMVRMIASAHSDALFGFGPHAFPDPAQKTVPQPEAAPAQTATQPVPQTTTQPADAPVPGDATGEGGPVAAPKAE